MTQDYDNMTDEQQLEFIKHLGLLIQFISEPSEQVQLGAVHQNSFSIKYIKNPTELVQIATVKDDPEMLYFITDSKILFKSTYALALSLTPSIKNQRWFKGISVKELK